MREIKFRAWDGSRFYYENDYYHIELTGDNEFFVIAKDETGGVSMSKWDHVFLCSNNPNIEDFDGQCVLQQFTGLRDRNGKEIYEGDIVKVDDSVCGNPIDGDRNGVYKVEYCLPDCAFGLVQLDGKSGIAFNEVMEYEVIGSVYENPELLNQ